MGELVFALTLITITILYFTIITYAFTIGVKSERQKLAEKKEKINKERLNRKNKIKKILSGAISFVRPVSYQDYSINVLANKNFICIFYTDLNKCVCYNKKEMGNFTVRCRTFLALCTLLKHVCNQITFDTTYDEIMKIIDKQIYITDINNYNLYPSKYQHYSINNMSAAELLSIPGMNLGRANKVVKYLKNHHFNSPQEFIDFVKLKDDDAKKMQDYFNNDTMCSIDKFIEKNLAE